MRNAHLVSLVAMLCGSAVSQTLTIPSEALARDGTGIIDAIGLERPGRVQFIIGAGHLAGAAGRSLTAVRLRRDGAKHDLLGGTLLATVRASASTLLNPNAPSARFASNHHVPDVTLYQGVLNAPTSPRLAHRNAATWSAADTVAIPFVRPWLYPGGTLCIDIELAPVAGMPRWWPLDGERHPPGDVVQRGRTWGSVGAMASVSASIDARTLRIGNMATFTTLGQPASLAVFMPLRQDQRRRPTKGGSS
jgi:hypothetical protein